MITKAPEVGVFEIKVGLDRIGCIIFFEYKNYCFDNSNSLFEPY